MRLSHWILAARPKTLPAAVIPVIVGSALAFRYESFLPLPAALCLVFAILIQIGTNFANDYFDWKQGADTKERIGPTRAVASGLVPPMTMLLVAILTLSLAFCFGLLLIHWGGAWLVGIGIASVVCAIAYTAQPIALGYRGLGDLFVVFFFGIVAVCVTVYVQTGFFPVAGWFIGLAIGLLSNNLLVINNYRDLVSDRKSGKRTLVVRFGPEFGERLVLASILIAGGVAIGLSILWNQWLLLLSLFGLLPVWRVYQKLPRALRREGFGNLLPKGARGLVLYGILFSLGLLVRF